jgi:hypothetical protein
MQILSQPIRLKFNESLLKNKRKDYLFNKMNRLDGSGDISAFQPLDMFPYATNRSSYNPRLEEMAMKQDLLIPPFRIFPFTLLFTVH